MMNLNLFFILISLTLVTHVSGDDPWPVRVVPVDEEDEFDSNVSGVDYEPDDKMWAVQNTPPVIYKLKYNGTYWLQDTNCHWKNGKPIYYPDGSGAPDAEDITKADYDETTVYVSTERDGDGKSRLSVLLYNTDASDCDDDDSKDLIAEMEWVLNDDLPDAPSNKGLEAITWVPDDYLVAREFYDEEEDKVYDPEDYPHHGNGLFFVGLEDNGKIYVFALNHNDGSSSRIADFKSGEKSIQALDFDRETNYLWAACDDTCSGDVNVFELPTDSQVKDGAEKGKFLNLATFNRPDSMPNLNNEGFAVGPESNCTESSEKFCIWSDDSNDDGHALREFWIPCGRFLSN